jgi:hypothetical protein
MSSLGRPRTIFIVSKLTVTPCIRTHPHKYEGSLSARRPDGFAEYVEKSSYLLEPLDCRRIITQIALAKQWSSGMIDEERAWAIKHILFDYVKSPSLKHIRDPHSITKLAREIVRRLDRGNIIWTKWTEHREMLLKSAVGCWVPIADLRTFLNAMRGPPLTMTDVDQRLKDFELESRIWANEELKDDCLAIYAEEREAGTDMPAILGRLREHVEHEETRLRDEQRAQWQKVSEEAQVAREQRLLSGADCKWTQIRGSKHWYCRTNGRTYRLSPTDDKKWNLYRVDAVKDDENGDLVGRYRGRGDATKVIAEMAYKPEPRWR